jgi:hypothetical protein
MPDEIPRQYDGWLAIGGDATGKRVVCKCAKCAHVCTIGREALEAGGVFCSGCASPAKPATPDARSDSFAGTIADTESRGVWKRHKGAP